MRLSALVGLALLAIPAASAQPVDATLDLVGAPGCVIPATAAPCPVGYDPGPGVLPGDDTLHVSSVVRKAAVSVQGLPLLPSRTVILDYDQTYVEHPVFITLEERWLAAHHALPEEAQRYVRLRSGTTNNGIEGMWISLSPYALLPGFDPEATQYVPVVVYWPHVVERERIYPLNTGGTETLESDEWIGAAGAIGGMCHWVEEDVLPSACHGRREVSAAAASALTTVLPNVATSGGLRRAEVQVGEALASLVAALKSTQAGIWSFSSTAPHTAAPGLAQAMATPVTPWASHPPAPAGESASTASLTPMSAALAQGSPPGPGLHTVVAATAAALLLAWALYRRIRREGLLQHPARKRILDLVAERPGLTVAQVAQGLGSDYKTAQHHVDLLVEAALVAVHLVGQQRRLFPATRDFHPHAREALLAQQRPRARRILAALRDLGPMTRSHLEVRTGLSRVGTYENLRDLTRLGMVVVDGRGRGARVRLGSPLEVSVGPSPGPGAEASPGSPGALTVFSHLPPSER